MAAPMSFRCALWLMRFYEVFVLRCGKSTQIFGRHKKYPTVAWKIVRSIPPLLRIRRLPHFAVAASVNRSLSLNINVRRYHCQPSVMSTARHVRFCSTSASCWNCKAGIAPNPHNRTPFHCSQCDAIQPVQENITHFQRMNCEPTFDLDLSYLQSSFRRLQSKLHPDKYATKSETELSHAAQQSSAVNKSYRTLQHPLSRGHYMLELAGLSVEEGESRIDPSFLLEIMEVNETLAELEDLEEVKKIGKSNSERLAVLTKELSQEFDSKNYDKAREILMRLKYYANIDDKVKEKLGTSTV